jgi:hypothetical protein
LKRSSYLKPVIWCVCLLCLRDIFFKSFFYYFRQFAGRRTREPKICFVFSQNFFFSQVHDTKSLFPHKIRTILTKTFSERFDVPISNHVHFFLFLLWLTPWKKKDFTLDIDGAREYFIDDRDYCFTSKRD